MGNLDKSEEKIESISEQKPLVLNKKCIHCKEDILSDAKICKHCGKAQPSKASAIIMACVSIFIAYIMITSVIGGPNTQTNDRKINSQVFAKEAIRKILKSPSTAKFSDVQAYELSDEKDVWAINGYVDSQNSFGAMMRNVWEVQIDYRNGKGGTIESVMFDGKKIL